MPGVAADVPVFNKFGQLVGFELLDWSPPPFPPHKSLAGRYCRVEPMTASHHAQALWNAQSKDPHGLRWTCMPFGPFAGYDEFEKWCVGREHSNDPQ
ncbi:hypothetical protein PC119_g2697 [Phytophthora cactorum]|nr:hypothetical protein PC114_g22061 [Phytophthora cactorum]KAG3038648.1 hypothetical protein PC119_g2697 [Phytophthora cactorum]KAG3143908.1 hypothetical protein C6341_g18916 [Phytophthora cactorum]KAG4040301.1 hypothetical protein PC123_g24159 [Phytophthora cactorum]